MSKQLLKLSLVITCNQLLLTDMALVDKVTADIKHFSENKMYNDIGWLILSMLESLEKEN